MGSVVLPLAGCTPALPDYRCRLTVEVETPEGIGRGSSVLQIAYHVSSNIRSPLVTLQRRSLERTTL